MEVVVGGTTNMFCSKMRYSVVSRRHSASAGRDEAYTWSRHAFESCCLFTSAIVSQSCLPLLDARCAFRYQTADWL